MVLKKKHLNKTRVVKEENEHDSEIIQSSFNASKSADIKELGNMIDKLERKLHKEQNSMSTEEQNKLEDLVSRLKKEYLETSVSSIEQERKIQNNSILNVKKLSEEHLLEIISLNLEPGKKLSQDPAFVCWYESKKLWIRKSKEPVSLVDPSKDVFKVGNKGNKKLPRNLKSMFVGRI